MRYSPRLLSSIANRDPSCSIYEHTPVPRSAKERAAGEAERRKRPRRLQEGEKAPRTRHGHVGHLPLSRDDRGAVRRYVHADAFPERSRRPRGAQYASTPSSRTLPKGGRRDAATPCSCGERSGSRATPAPRVGCCSGRGRGERNRHPPRRAGTSMVERCQKRTLFQGSVGRTNRAPSPKRLVWLLLRIRRAWELTNAGR